MRRDEYILSLIRRGIRNRQERICFDSGVMLDQEKLNAMIMSANEGNACAIQNCRADVYPYSGEYQYTLHLQYRGIRISESEKKAVVQKRDSRLLMTEPARCPVVSLDPASDNAIQELAEEIFANICNGNKEFEICSPHNARIADAIEHISAVGPNIAHVVSSIEAVCTDSLFRKMVVCRPQYVLGTYSVKRLFLQAKDQAAKIASEVFHEGMDIREKAQTAHDYLCATVRYDTESSKDKLKNCYAHGAYGALVNRCGVCQGIADAYMMLLKLVGVNCLLIHGLGFTERGSERHTWNLVQDEASWFHVDVTWDIGSNGSQRYKYFMLDSSEMMKDHSWNTAVYGKYV